MINSAYWALPFCGLILSIALTPLISPSFWQRHAGSIALFWAATLLLPLGFSCGTHAAIHVVNHALIDHYIPFIILVGSLYIMASGISIRASHAATPRDNTILLGTGALLASLIGTTGAAIILIRPLLDMNKTRKQRQHLVIFFIFLVANIGGSLTPVGDPPLFIGFLSGIPFSWPFLHLSLPFVAVTLPLLIIFYCLDRFHFQKDTPPPSHGRDDLPRKQSVTMEGKHHFIFVAAAMGLTLLASTYTERMCSLVSWTWGDGLRNGSLLLLAYLSWKSSSPAFRAQNHFDWHPVTEVAKLFAAIFITIAPIIELLQQGQEGPFSFLLAKLIPEGRPDNFLLFWIVGMLSAFLDNAPTYLVFFKLAGGDPLTLTTTLAPTLTAISLGAVFMGALTYIGNAPNFMVKSIAEENGVAMPSFFGYMAWSCLLLLPLFTALGWILFE